MFGQKGPCFTCEYLKENEKWNGEVYCEYLKAYIKPDIEGCSNYIEEE